MEPRRSQDTGKTSKRISGDLYPPVGGYDFVPLPLCSFMCDPVLLCKTPVAYILGLSLVSKDSTFPGSFRG